jgi:hypothetical protein
VFKEALHVKAYALNKNVKIFKCPQYPLNEFKLDFFKDDKYVYFNFYISGPIITELSVIVSKENEKFGKKSKKLFFIS